MLFVGIHVGIEGVRTVAADREGRLLAEGYAEHQLHRPNPAWLEQNPEDWWNATVKSAQQVTKALGPQARQIKAVGLAGQMRGAVLIDAAMQVIRPAILGDDQRAGAEAAEITARVGAERLVDIAVSPALGRWTAPKLLWVKQHEPEHWARVRQVLLPKDYIRYRMTGMWATDRSDAAGTLLFDVNRQEWSAELCEALGVPLNWLPPAHHGHETTGQVIPGIMAMTGIPAWTPVVAGGGDELDLMTTARGPALGAAVLAAVGGGAFPDVEAARAVMLA